MRASLFFVRNIRLGNLSIFKKKGVNSWLSLPYKRSFNSGRGSELLYNEDLHKIYETTRHISEQTKNNEEPEIKMHGALWRDDRTNELKYCNTTKNKWEIVFGSKFQITDQMLVETLPANPVIGQLWIHNQTLYYYDGAEWVAIKAQLADDNPFSQAAFSDFSLISPLDAVGNTVTKLEETNSDYYQHYYEDKMDYTNKQDYVYGNKWTNENWNSPFTDPAYKDLPKDSKSQFILPNVTYDKFFITHTLRHDFEKVSSICLQYPTTALTNTRESAVHINYGKLTNITKRLVKVNKENPTIDISPYQTEFYGFRNTEYLGSFLIPSDTVDEGDYVIDQGKIILNQDAAQNFDYVLACTYMFSWIRDTGSAKIKDSKELSSGYHLQDMKVPMNVFINGLNLEDRFYDVDTDSESVTITDENYDPEKYTIDFLSSPGHEFGYIRDTDLQDRGIIKLLNPVRRPLVFISGQLMHPTLDNLEYNQDRIYVPGAKINMPWTVIETKPEDGSEGLLMTAGRVENSKKNVLLYDSTLTSNNDLITSKDAFDKNKPDTFNLKVDKFSDSTTNKLCITIPDSWGTDEQSVVLFLNGLLISSEDIYVNLDQHIVTVKNRDLQLTDTYVLLKDSDGYLYNILKAIPALDVGHVDNAMIYMNGKLLCNLASIVELKNPDAVDTNSLANNEVRFFVSDKFNQTVGTFKIYDSFKNTWTDATADEKTNITTLINSYVISVSSIDFVIKYTTQDEIIVYGIKYANTINDILKIGTATLDTDPNNPNYNVNKDYYYIKDTYTAGAGMLNLFVNGVKQINGIDFKEQYDGQTVRFMNPSILENASIRYIIETPEKGNDRAATVVTLKQDNMISTNVYEIPDSLENVSFFPGRLSVYRNGIRLKKSDWALLGNRTIMIKNTPTPVVGTVSNNYPDEYISDNGKAIKVTHKQPDVIAVEIRQDYDRQEYTFVAPGGSEMNLESLHIPSSILETKDEILIYVNGVFTGLSEKDKNSYHTDPYKECLSIDNPKVLESINIDPLWKLLQDKTIYDAWKLFMNKDEYTQKKNEITIVWR